MGMGRFLETKQTVEHGGPGGLGGLGGEVLMGCCGSGLLWKIGNLR